MVDSPTDDAEEQKLLGRALASLRKARGLNQAEAGAGFWTDEDLDLRRQEATGMSGQNWQKYEAGERPGIFKPDIQRRLVEAIGFTVEELRTERDRLSSFASLKGRFSGHAAASKVVALPTAARGAPISNQLCIRDRVQAGAWLLADDLGQEEARAVPFLPDPRYAHARQWVSEVIGDSVNKLNIFNGDLAWCVDAIDIGYVPATGDVVEVERTRFDGAERELTIKQIEVTPDGVLLWPRSTNPRWQSPLDLAEGIGDGEDYAVRIRAKVLSAIHKLP